MYNIYVQEFSSLLLRHLAFHRWILPSFSHRIPPRNWQINPKITSCMERVLIQPPRNTFFFFFFFFFLSIRDWSNVKPSVCHSFKGKLITLKQNARGWRIIDFLVVPCRHFRARGLSLRSPLISSFGMLYWIFFFVFFFFFNSVRSISNIYLRSLSYVYDFLKTKGKL